MRRKVSSSRAAVDISRPMLQKASPLQLAVSSGMARLAVGSGCVARATRHSNQSASGDGSSAAPATAAGNPNPTLLPAVFAFLKAAVREAMAD